MWIFTYAFSFPLMNNFFNENKLYMLILSKKNLNVVETFIFKFVSNRKRNAMHPSPKTALSEVVAYMQYSRKPKFMPIDRNP